MKEKVITKCPFEKGTTRKNKLRKERLLLAFTTRYLYFHISCTPDSIRRGNRSKYIMTESFFGSVAAPTSDWCSVYIYCGAGCSVSENER